MDYSFLRRRYEGHVAVGKVDTKLIDFRPFAWMTQAEFSLGTNLAEVKSLRWSSGRSRMEASGRISDFRNPKIEASYDALIDLGETAAIAHRNDLRAGVAQFKGRGTWSLEQFATNGAVVIRDLGWQDKDFVVKSVGATSEYTVTDVELSLTKLQGKALGGSFTGDAQVDNWLHHTPGLSGEKAVEKLNSTPREELPVISAARPRAKNSPKVKPALVQSGAVHLHVRDISAAEIAVAASHALGRFRPVGF